ncbi:MULTISPECIES: hypothetical protein [unclassified Modestobacter]|uniref:hypothetical protein n=1 Tax=unclassified Modestobacter TaxID=2643866 RepID=UPI0022AB39F2|nr:MULTISPECIES: hypothetical protein [unclassified Modestobacter]MCZ2826022.1 hypothetical protein [Modestobacter sp. VKM Ac-2981]MCZ2852913.1 hypothetical protein [Modestobacter sp. VKM Ac-2982]
MTDDGVDGTAASPQVIPNARRASSVAGDWSVPADRVAGLANTPGLIDLTILLVDEPPHAAQAVAAHSAVIDAVGESTSPTIFIECLTALLESPSVLQTSAVRLSDMCLRAARPPAPSAGLQEWLRAAKALEGATRIALGEWVSHFAVLAQLVQLPPVSPPSFARVALRCLAAAYERWREQALVAAMEQLAGLNSPVAAPVDPETAKNWSHEVAADAAYELGCASLLQALGGQTLTDTETHLQDAERRLDVAAASRVDAAAMADVSRLLAAHLPTDTGRALLSSTDLPGLAVRLDEHVREHVFWSTGLPHWRFPRLDAEVAWVGLANDVVRSSAALTEPSWYQAEAMLAHVLAAYTASRCSRVLRREDQVGVAAILGPVIEDGIAVRAGLMKHLDDHVRALEAGIAASGGVGTGVGGPADEGAVDVELEAARSLLAAAREKVVNAERFPKAKGGADAFVSTDGQPELPLLEMMLDHDLAALTSIPAHVAQALERRIAEGHEGTGFRASPGDVLVINETFARVRRELSASAEYRGDVKFAVDEILLLLLRFWRSRDGLGEAEMPYLFKADALEKELAADLKTWFDGTPHAGRTKTEVRHVGGGRVDVACVFPLFTLYIELKKDVRKMDLVKRSNFLSQTSGYQSADVRLGFMAVLDLRKRTGPTPSLDFSFDVVSREDPELGQPRYVVAMLVPGNRTDPSSMR